MFNQQPQGPDSISCVHSNSVMNSWQTAGLSIHCKQPPAVSEFTATCSCSLVPRSFEQSGYEAAASYAQYAVTLNWLKISQWGKVGMTGMD